MQVIPAIDIRGGKCVRLYQGDYAQETIFGEDPVAIARKWADQGAQRLHLVDLDGAKEGRSVNSAVVADICRTVSIPCQLGGGIRDEDGLSHAFDLGVDRVIVGTKALRDPEFFKAMARRYPDQLLLGLDCRDGMVATGGWLETSKTQAVDLLPRFEALELAGIVYTDIAKDGTMSGPNLPATVALAKATKHRVIASGGISCEEDVHRLAEAGITACILGRSIYEGRVNIARLIEYFEGIALKNSMAALPPGG